MKQQHQARRANGKESKTAQGAKRENCSRRGLLYASPPAPPNE